MDHRAFIGSVDPQRRMRLAGGRPADQQRNAHFRAAHFLGNCHHLVQRRGNQAGESDDIRVVFPGRFEDLRPRNHHAHVDHFVAIALQNHSNDVLADVVHIALHRRHDDLALGAGTLFLLRLDIGDQVGHGLLHHACGFHDLR